MLGLFFPQPRHAEGRDHSGRGFRRCPHPTSASPDITKVARSTNDAEASTKFCVDLGAAYALRAFALVNHNLSAAAQWRILLGTTAARPTSTGTLADWLSATFDASMAALGMQDAEYLRDGTPAVIVLPTVQTARYVTVEISDTSNPTTTCRWGGSSPAAGFRAQLQRHAAAETAGST